MSYAGKLRVESELNGKTIVTDGPKEFLGQGEYFSPTDLLATSLGTCILTVMGIQAKKMGFDLEGATCEVEKEMVSGPRRIGKIAAHVKIPLQLPLESKQKLERAAMTCPVHASLHPEMIQEITFEWD